MNLIVSELEYSTLVQIFINLSLISVEDVEILQAMDPNLHHGGVLRSLRSSDPPLDVRTIGLLRSLRSDQDFPDAVHRDAMMRSLRSFPPAFFQESKQAMEGSRTKKFLPIGEKVLRTVEQYGQPDFYEDLTLRYL